MFGDQVPTWDLGADMLRWHHLQWTMQRRGLDVADALAVYGVDTPSELFVQKVLFFESPHQVHLPVEPGVRDALFEALIGDTPMTLTEARAAAERWFLFAVFERFEGSMVDVCRAWMMRGYMVAQIVERLGEPPGYVARELRSGWEP